MSDINVTVQDEIVNIDVLDTPVLVNVVNSPGQQGPAGPGVPVGGTAGQILAKASATNYDTEWINNYAKYLATNVRNQTGSTINAFQVVYISGATGNKPLISLADADTEATSSKTYGVTATSIANNGTGDVVTAGELSGINTSAFNEGDLLWLSTTAGGVVTTPPAEPAHAVFIGYVVRSHPTLGTIDVSIKNGYELNELHGVQITSAANNEGLFYNSSNSLWENKTIATVLGYTPEQPLTFNSPLSRAGNVVSIPQATGSVNGFLSATDWTTFNSKQNALGFTPANAATTLTINGVTFDLSANRSWTIAAGISGSGANGQVTYWTGASAVSGSNNLFWDATNSVLGVGTNTPNVNSVIHANKSQNTLTSIFVTNDNAGTAAHVGFRAGLNPANFSTDYISMFILGANWVTAGALKTKSGVIENFGSNFVISNYNNSEPIVFATTTSRTERMRIAANGNVGINTASDPSVRFQVVGDTLLRGSGATSATTALTVQNSSSTNLLTVRNDGFATFNGSISQTNISDTFTSGNAINFVSSQPSITGSTSLSLITGSAGQTNIGKSAAITNASGVFQVAVVGTDAGNFRSFSPTSGTATYTVLRIAAEINQTGGANGITRGLYVNPTLTAAADFRAIETSAGNVLFGSNFFWDNANSRLGIGTNAPAFDLSIVKSTTATIGIRSTTSTEYVAINFYNSANAIVGGFGYGNSGTAAMYANKFYFAGVSGVPISFIVNGAEYLRMFPSTGNLVLQNSGTFSDGGQRLQVYGDTLLRGSGATSATAALLVQNSSSTNLFEVYNDGQLYILGGNVSGFGTNIKIGGRANTANINFFGNNNIYVGQAGAVENLPSALIAMGSTTKGFLPPRMTTTQKNSIATPAAGLVVYDTTLNKLCVYTTAWETITSV